MMELTDLSKRRIIDSHQHLWAISERPYEWIEPSLGPLFRDFSQADIQPVLDSLGISETVLVQASDSYADTFFLMEAAKKSEQIVGVVGWVPLDRTGEAAAALEALKSQPVIKGFRALTHGYEDPNWIIRPEVGSTLKLLLEFGFTLDYVATNPEHRLAILQVARENPNLKIVLDHLTKPNIMDMEWEPWASSIELLAGEPNVFAKISGLNTLSKPGWTTADWTPYFDWAMSKFGSNRLMVGSDWPFALLGDHFEPVWSGLLELVGSLSESEQSYLLAKTASSFYSLD